jgi:hypothetical protein
MSRRFMIALLVVLFSVSITAYSNDKSTVAANERNSTIEAYKKVLQNEVAFFDVFGRTPDKKEKVYLQEFLAGMSRDYPAKITHFTILDMDGDEIPEVVLKIKISGADFREVLHYYDGEVYGYLFGIRSLGGLKTDGTFFGSGGVASTYCRKLQFSKNTAETVTLAYSTPLPGNNVAYFINIDPVSAEAFRSFIDGQRAKEDVVWYEFSPEDVETQLAKWIF